LRWKLNLSDEYIFKQCDEGEEIIAEHFFTGRRIWNGQYWVLRLRMSDYSVHKLFVLIGVRLGAVFSDGVSLSL